VVDWDGGNEADHGNRHHLDQRHDAGLFHQQMVAARARPTAAVAAFREPENEVFTTRW
jgi:hypothetical protein